MTTADPGRSRRKRRATTVGDEGLLRGRFTGGVHPALDRINRSFAFDRRMWHEDITGSEAHARMLGAQGVLPAKSVRRILKGLAQVAAEFEAGTFVDHPEDEDIHMAVERRLTELVGEDGKRLHAGRSRNDQVATDTALYLHGMRERLAERVVALQSTLVGLAARDGELILPYYTHLQRAQPVLLGHVLLAWVEMLEDDRAGLAQPAGRDLCPLGAGAGTGTSFPLDRRATAKALGFAGPTRNSLASVSSRRELTMAAAAMATTATTLSRLGADLVLWCSREFGFARLGDAVSTGSSIMPQKRNPDGAELLRAKAVVVSGSLSRLLELQRALPLGYSKDLQEDKPALFEAEDTLIDMLDVARAMLEDVSFDGEAMRAAVEDPAGFLLATEAADFLVKQGVSFREAHEAVGALVSEAEARGVGLAELPDEVFKRAHRRFDGSIRKALTTEAALAARRLVGGTAPTAVRRELAAWTKRLGP